jgi:hypothetical protein
LSSKAATTGISFDLSGKERWPNKKPPNKPVELTAHSVRFSPDPTLSPVGRSSPVALGFMKWRDTKE